MDPPIPLGQFPLGAQSDQNKCGNVQSGPNIYAPYSGNSFNNPFEHVEHGDHNRFGDFNDFTSPQQRPPSPALIDVVGCEEGQNLAGNLKTGTGSAGNKEEPNRYEQK